MRRPLLPQAARLLDPISWFQRLYLEQFMELAFPYKRFAEATGLSMRQVCPCNRS